MVQQGRTIAKLLAAGAGTLILAINNVQGFVQALQLSWLFLGLGAVIAAAVVLHPVVREAILRGRFVPLSGNHSAFRPFRKVEDAQPGDLWAREEDVSRLATKIEKSPLRHVVVSGPSGVGKSTLVRHLLPGSIPDLGPLVYVSRYEAALTTTLLTLMHWDARMVGQVREALARLHGRTWELRSFRKASPEGELDALYEVLEQLVDNAPDTVVVLDQYERFVDLFDEELARGAFSAEVLGFVKLLELVRRKRSVRTVFSIRSDRYFGVLALFDLIATGGADESPVTSVIVGGIDNYSAPKAANHVSSWLNKIPGASSYVTTMSAALGLNTRGRSNTFVTQVYGFIVAGYYPASKRVVEMVQKGHRPDEALDVFLQVLRNDFETTHPDVPVDFLVAVLGCISLYNKSRGLPLSAEDTALIVHLPADAVHEIARFLHQAGVLVDESIGGQMAFRVVHDVLADRVIASEEFTVQPLWKEGMQGLIEQRAPLARIRRVDRLPHLIYDLFSPRSISWLGLLAIALFFVHGVLTLNWPVFCEVSLQTLPPLPAFVGPSVACPQYEWEHLLVFVPHMLWLWYIYDVTEGYLLRMTSGPLRGLVASMPFIGAVAAIACAHYPQLLVVPIAIVGLLLAVALMWGARNGDFVGQASKSNWLWGLRTLFNMLFALVLTFLSILDFQAQQPTATLALFSWADPWGSLQLFVQQAGKSGIFLALSSIVMSYFWWHIYPNQQSAPAAAARLAYHDRAKSARSLHDAG